MIILCCWFRNEMLFDYIFEVWLSKSQKAGRSIGRASSVVVFSDFTDRTFLERFFINVTHVRG